MDGRTRTRSFYLAAFKRCLQKVRLSQTLKVPNYGKSIDISPMLLPLCYLYDTVCWRSLLVSSPFLQLDRLVSLLLVIVVGWFIYARYEEANNVLYGPRPDSSSVSENRGNIGDFDISNSEYLPRRESGSGGFIPQELKDLLVMGGVDKGPPSHHSTGNKNWYLK